MLQHQCWNSFLIFPGCESSPYDQFLCGELPISMCSLSVLSYPCSLLDFFYPKLVHSRSLTVFFLKVFSPSQATFPVFNMSSLIQRTYLPPSPTFLFQDTTPHSLLVRGQGYFGGPLLRVSDKSLCGICKVIKYCLRWKKDYQIPCPYKNKQQKHKIRANWGSWIAEQISRASALSKA